MQVIEPIRVVRSYTQKLCAEPERIFPLLCPVREAEWLHGWNPLIVYSQSGFAETDCIFLTGDQGVESLWTIINRDEHNLVLELLKVTPWTTVAHIRIALKANERHGTDAEVTYTYTAIDEKGREFVENYTESFFEEFMQYWETALNQYLKSDGIPSSHPQQDLAPQEG